MSSFLAHKRAAICWNIWDNVTIFDCAHVWLYRGGEHGCWEGLGVPLLPSSWFQAQSWRQRGVLTQKNAAALPFHYCLRERGNVTLRKNAFPSLEGGDPQGHWCYRPSMLFVQKAADPAAAHWGEDPSIYQELAKQKRLLLWSVDGRRLDVQHD